MTFHFSKDKEEYRAVSKLLEGVLSVLGFFLFGFFIYKLIQGFNGFDWPEVLHDFGLPCIVSAKSELLKSLFICTSMFNYYIYIN